MNINTLKIFLYSIFIIMLAAFPCTGDKYDSFFQDIIAKLYKITPETWEIRIIKSAKPYGYKSSSMQGVFISFSGKTAVQPLYPKRLSDHESFYLVIMPPEFLAEPIDEYPGPAMMPDKFLGKTRGYKIFFQITGTVDGSIPTWTDWEKHIKTTLQIK